PAAHALGRYHRERGDEPAAEYWLRQSAESGHALGAYALADLLEHRGDAGAERWFRSAAERGHREAAYRLARILDVRERGPENLEPLGPAARRVALARPGGSLTLGSAALEALDDFADLHDFGDYGDLRGTGRGRARPTATGTGLWDTGRWDTPSAGAGDCLLYTS
ncbi:hypothetical protein ADK38_13330, partial [Streptomyces varsoviensis]